MTHIIRLGFVRCKVDHYVYSKQVCHHFINIVLYVDDMLIRNKMNVIEEVKSHLSSKFNVKDLSVASFILGMEIERDHANMKLWLNKRKHVKMILQRFGM